MGFALFQYNQTAYEAVVAMGEKEGRAAVILLRPTASPIVYLQQIGRVLSAGDGSVSVIFDLTAYYVDGVKLGRWISNIRAKRKNVVSSGMVLNEERIRQLDNIGMDWK